MFSSFPVSKGFFFDGPPHLWTGGPRTLFQPESVSEPVPDFVLNCQVPQNFTEATALTIEYLIEVGLSHCLSLLRLVCETKKLNKSEADVRYLLV